MNGSGDFQNIYSLKEDPFSPSPDDRFYFPSLGHELAIRKLRFCIDWGKGLAVVIGGTGTGKTTLCRRLLELLPGDRFSLTYVVATSPETGPDWLLRKILCNSGFRERVDGIPSLFSALQNTLVKEMKRGKRGVIIIDEAQLFLTEESAEVLRGLSNLEIPGRKLLTLLLFGLTSLEDFLKLDEAFKQRIGVRCNLLPFDEETTLQYIRHRIVKAGGKRMPFTREAARTIHRYSMGIPRLINAISGNSLFEGGMMNAETITSRMVVKAALDLGLSIEGITRGREAEPPPSSVTFPEESGPLLEKGGGPTPPDEDEEIKRVLDILDE